MQFAGFGLEILYQILFNLIKRNWLGRQRGPGRQTGRLFCVLDKLSFAKSRS